MHPNDVKDENATKYSQISCQLFFLFFLIFVDPLHRRYPNVHINIWKL